MLFLFLDIAELDAKVKHLNLIDYADGMSFYYEALESQHTTTQTRLLTVAKEKLECALMSMANNVVALLKLALVFRMMAKTGHDPPESFAKAQDIYSQLLRDTHPPHLQAEIHMEYANTLRKSALRSGHYDNISTATEQYQFALKLHPKSAKCWLGQVRSLLLKNIDMK